MSQFREFQCNLETFIEDLQAIIAQNEQRVTQLLAIEEKSYANFARPLQMQEEAISHHFTPLSHLNAVNNSEATQKVYTESLPILTEYSTKISQNLDIYTAYKEIYTKEKASLNHEQNRVLELSIQSFELSGAHLDEKTKSRLQEINLRKSELTNNFSQNLLDATNAYEYIISNPDDVKGIPESDLENAEFEEDGITKYKFTLQMPSYIAYMTYGPNREIREAIYKAYVSRAPQNAEIIDELLALRDEMSKLLGFKNYASYSLASKMAPDEESVLKFLHELLENSKKQAQKELKELQEFAPHKLENFDTAYYSEKLKKAEYDLDEEEYRPYFEQNSVMQGMFSFLYKLFNIEFKKIDNATLWHEKAAAYDIYKEGVIKARLYTDLEARESKRGGAWMHNYETHCIDENNTRQLASAFIVCNFPPSNAKAPSLLRHDDVVTLFHEMGHAIHHLLSDVNENEVSGVNGVEWDAVEFPSQFLESFAYEPQVLQLFAKHYKTKEVIPDNMIEKLVKSKNFLSAMGMLRQLEFSIFDFQLHTELYKEAEVQALLNTIRENTALIQAPEYNKFQNGFSHIFAGGYAAGYYSYKWAEVLSADAFYQVIDEGIFDSPTAKKYSEIVLSGGGAKSMQILFNELLGRDADVTQLLRLNAIA
ncbi:MAG: M3 family metallopeptidase [Campylobacterales bacterium]|nr:M3 family metallopeptidase [Campylobacterales bacterium]